MTSILLVDDEDMLRQVVRMMLERRGYDVIEAADGELGDAAYRKSSPDIVITDIVMPNKDGLQLIADLKRDFPDVRIIAMSGGARTSDQDPLELARQMGVQRILRKPFSRAELYDALATVEPPPIDAAPNG